MYAFIDAHHEAYGVEPICQVLEIAPSGYYRHRAQQADATCRSARAQRDTTLLDDIRRVFRQHHEVYGVRKIWHQLHREGIVVARCTVERLMRAEGLQGVVRGQRVRTTQPDDTATPSADLVQRQFSAAQPNQLWVADFTYVATWRGFVYVAFVIDVFSRRIVGWRAHTTMRTALVLDALEQALHDRELDGRLIVHTDRGAQGGFNRSSQHRVVRQNLDGRSAPLPASSTPTSSVACYSGPVLRRESRAHSIETSRCPWESIVVAARSYFRWCRVAMDCEGPQRRPAHRFRW